MVNCVEETSPGHTAYFHLTRGLFARDIEFNKAPVKNQPGTKMKEGIISCQEDFNVHEDMQRALAHIRTDLDSFTDVEAGCLKADAYQMSEKPLKNLPAQYLSTETKVGNWQFTPYIAKLATNDEIVLKHLRVASSRVFKPFILMFKGTLGFGQSLVLLLLSVPVVAILAFILYLISMGFGLLMSYSIWQVITNQDYFQRFLNDAAPYLYGLLVAFTISTLADKLIESTGKWAVRIRKLIKSPMSLITGALIRVILPAIFALPVILYIYTIDWFFVNKIGKLK